MSFKLMFLVTMVLVSLTMAAVEKETENENDGFFPFPFSGSGSGSGGSLKVVCTASYSVVQKKKTILSAQAVHEPDVCTSFPALQAGNSV